MIEPIIFESVVNNLLRAAVQEWRSVRAEREVDFIAERPSGEKVAIEVKSGRLSGRNLDHLASQAHRIVGQADAFILVTPAPPTPEQTERFNYLFSDIPIESSWVGINELPQAIGIESPGDLLAPETVASLKWKALQDNVQSYSAENVGPHLGLTDTSPEARLELPSAYVSLSRQLSFASIQRLISSEDDLDSSLQLGRKVEGATVVLSDLKNFSSLVSASRSEDLSEMMSRYYRLSREAVFDNGGMLDNFIGDAVLAVFGYPKYDSSSAVRAIRFSKDLIGIGNEILTAWKAELNAIIDSGTRVGMATGDIWPLNIGQDDFQLTLLGDTINLAARLEKNSAVDSVLMDNRTKTRAVDHDSDFVESLALEDKSVDPDDAKGQQFPIQAWQHSVTAA